MNKMFRLSVLATGIAFLLTGCVQYIPSEEQVNKSADAGTEASVEESADAGTEASIEEGAEANVEENAEASTEDSTEDAGLQEEGEYISPDGWSVKYPVPDVAANEIDEHTASFVYMGECAGTNMVTISYVEGKQPEEAMTEITEAWGDGDDIIRTEGIFPGTYDKWGYWRALPIAEEGSGYNETLIGGEYNGGALLFDIIGHNGEDEEQNMLVGDTLAYIIDSIKYDHFDDQTIYEYIPGTYSRKDEDTGAVYSIMLNKDHTGAIIFEEDEDIYWGSYMITNVDSGEEYEYTIEGDELLLDQDGTWVSYIREEKKP